LRLRVKGITFVRNEVLAREGTSDEAAIGCRPAPERASRTGLHVPFLLGVPK
jgi:hypothetical protein